MNRNVKKKKKLNEERYPAWNNFKLYNLSESMKI